VHDEGSRDHYGRKHEDEELRTEDAVREEEARWNESRESDGGCVVRASAVAATIRMTAANWNHIAARLDGSDTSAAPKYQ
jgi:hypothetical protein